MRTTALLFLACPFFCQIAESQPYTISTVAGATRVVDGMAATSAPLRDPVSVALDSNGNLYIADALDNRVRKVDPSGVISTLAGTGLPGYSGDRGPAGLAQLSSPVSVAVDAKGNVFIADRGNAVIRRISSDGTINTVAGNGSPQFAGDNGPATQAQFDPMAVAADAQGNFYIADSSNYRIRKVDANGIITTIAGTGIFGPTVNGPATATQIGLIQDLAVDPAGNLYMADFSNLQVAEVTAAGMFIVIAGGVQYGSIDDGVPATSAVMIPYGVALDGSSTLYISDVSNTVVRRVDLSSGLIYTTAGSGSVGFSGDGGNALFAGLNYPAGLAAKSGVVYFADVANERVRKVANSIITTVAGTSIHDNGPAVDAFLNLPEGIAVDGGGNILLADTNNAEVRQFKVGGVINPVGQLNGGSPYGLAVDKAGNFYVTDEEFSFSGPIPHVLKIGIDGTNTIIAGRGASGFFGDEGPATLASLNAPQGIAVDAAGNVVFADHGNHRVRKIDTNGKITTIAGNGNVHFSGDNGPATSAGIDPNDVAIDNAGNILVADSSNNRIRKIATDGTITTFAGMGSAGSSGDGGPAVNAQLDLPTGVALDHSGNLYIADALSAVVRRVNLDGLITTIAGNGTFTPSAGDGGPATAAQLDPFSVAVDQAGNVYVSDNINDRVRMLTPQTIKPANMIAVSGDGQSGGVGTGLVAPLVLKVVDSTGVGIPGVVVSFSVTPEGAASVTPSPAVTLNDGSVTAMVSLGDHAGNITITVSSYTLRSITFSLTAIASNSPSIAAGGIVSAGLSNPQVNVLSPNAIVTVFGSNFAPAGTAKTAGLVNGQLPTNLDGVCVEFGTVRAPIFALYPGQINLQVPGVATGNVPVQVITACDTPQAVGSSPVSVAAQATAPEFFYFTTGGSGGQPVAAIDAVTGGYIGAPGLITGATFTPAKPGGYLTLFATGFGATDPVVPPGVLPSGDVPVTASVSIQFGGVTLAPTDILYVGLSQFAGLYQVNIHVPTNVPDGDQALVITVGGVASPSNAFITVKSAQ